MESRIELIAPDIASALRRAGSRTSLVAVLAAQRALASVVVADAVIRSTLESLSAGGTSFARAARGAVATIAEACDEEYLTLYKAAGEVNSPEVVAAFSKARAVSALAAALGPDPVEAAGDALYEACAALGEHDAARLLEDARTLLDA